MPRMHILTMTASTLTSGTGTILWANAHASRTFELARVTLGQRATLTAQLLVARLSRQLTSFPTLVTTNATLAKVDPGDSACALTLATTGAAGTCGVNASAEGAGAKTTVTEFDFLNTAGLDIWFPERERIILPGGDTSGLSLHLPVAPTDLTLWSAAFWLLER